MGQSANDLQAVAQIRPEGLNTIGILASLLKRQNNADQIPTNDPALRRCVGLKYGLMRNTFVDDLLQSLSPLDDRSKSISTGLTVLEKIPEGKMSVPTFAKELGSLNDSLKELKATRELALKDYDTFNQERDVVISNVIDRILKASDRGDKTDVTQDQVITNDFARLDQMRKVLLHKLEQFSRVKSNLTEAQNILLKKVLERTPAEKRVTAMPQPSTSTAPTSQGG